MNMPCSIAFRIISSRSSVTSSLPCSFAPQGLFCPGQMHLYPDLLLHRDYFSRSDSSLSGSFVPQGLFRPSRFISIWLFCSTGIISAVWIHLYLAFLFHRDYFNRPDSSLSGFFAPQRLFQPPGFISILLFCSTGIISTVRIHLYLAFLFHRDYFGHSDSSLSCSFAPQGLFQTKQKPETLKIQGFRLVEMTGIEPATSRLRTWRSPS